MQIIPITSGLKTIILSLPASIRIGWEILEMGGSGFAILIVLLNRMTALFTVLGVAGILVLKLQVCMRMYAYVCMKHET
jgi:hypothetical protein